MVDEEEYDEEEYDEEEYDEDYCYVDVYKYDGHCSICGQFMMDDIERAIGTCLNCLYPDGKGKNE